MTTRTIVERGVVGCAAVSVLSVLSLFAGGCDREVSKTKESSSKVVDTPDGPKKVTETKETTTIKEKKND